MRTVVHYLLRKTLVCLSRVYFTLNANHEHYLLASMAKNSSLDNDRFIADGLVLFHPDLWPCLRRLLGQSARAIHG